MQRNRAQIPLLWGIIWSFGLVACTTLPPLEEVPPPETNADRMVLDIRRFVDSGDARNPESVKAHALSGSGDSVVYRSINDEYVCVKEEHIWRYFGHKELDVADGQIPIIRDFANKESREKFMKRPRRSIFERASVIYDGVGPNGMNVNFSFDDFYCVQDVFIWQPKR